MWDRPRPPRRTGEGLHVGPASPRSCGGLGRSHVEAFTGPMWRPWSHVEALAGFEPRPPHRTGEGLHVGPAPPRGTSQGLHIPAKAWTREGLHVEALTCPMWRPSPVRRLGGRSHVEASSRPWPVPRSPNVDSLTWILLMWTPHVDPSTRTFLRGPFLCGPPPTWLVSKTALPKMMHSSQFRGGRLLSLL